MSLRLGLSAIFPWFDEGWAVWQERHRGHVVSFLVRRTQRHTMSVCPTTGDNNFTHWPKWHPPPVGFSDHDTSQPLACWSYSPWECLTGLGLNYLPYGDFLTPQFLLNLSTDVLPYGEASRPPLIIGLFVSVADSCSVRWSISCDHRHLLPCPLVPDLTCGTLHFVLNLSFFQGSLPWAYITFVLIGGKTAF